MMKGGGIHHVPGHAAVGGRRQLDGVMAGVPDGGPGGERRAGHQDDALKEGACKFKAVAL